MRSEAWTEEPDESSSSRSSQKPKANRAKDGENVFGRKVFMVNFRYALLFISFHFGDIFHSQREVEE